MVVLAFGQDTECLIVVVDAFLAYHEIERMDMVYVELVSYRVRHGKGKSVSGASRGLSRVLVWREVRI